MAYQAIAQMQKKNRELFGENAGPKQPDRYNRLSDSLESCLWWKESDEWRLPLTTYG